MRGFATTGRQRADTREKDAGAGALPKRESSKRQRTVALTAALCACGVVVLGCGNSAQKQVAHQLEDASVLSNTVPLSERLVKQSEIESSSDSAAQRTFMELWSLLQYGAWDQAEQLFQPGLRDTIGPSLLAQALAQDLIIWQSTKPRITQARVTDSTALITFLARDEKGNVAPASISFQRTNGNWMVSYFSLLDGALQRSVQLRIQSQIEPLGTKPAAEAVRQGDSASTLQSTYLEHQLHVAVASRRSGRRAKH